MRLVIFMYTQEYIQYVTNHVTLQKANGNFQKFKIDWIWVSSAILLKAPHENKFSIVGSWIEKFQFYK